MKNATELSPCPFCGALPKTGFHGDEDGGYHYVECLSCRRPKELDAERFIGAHGESAHDAIAAWNTRASPAPGREPLTDEQIAVLQFLYGLGNLDGCGFGDRPHGERGMYWWRKHLRAAFPGIAPAGGIGGE